MRDLRGNRGTSIVEVLVVMVVLLVGILTVVRLFPPGFTSVRHAESLTFASRLAQYEIERWKNNAANLPEGILPISATPPIIVLNGQKPGPPIDEQNATAFRRIIGETTRIPFGGWSTAPQSGSVYILSFAPILDPSVGGQFAVRAGDLSRRIFDASDTEGPDPWRVLRLYQYGIDYDDLKICFRTSNQDRIFYLSLSWWEQPSGGQPELRTVTNITLGVPGGTADWINFGPVITGMVQQDATFIGIDPYSESVSRGFVRLAPSDGWSANDPYEYKLIDPTLGIVSFNPLGYVQKEFGQPLQARIDYDILDLEIIREDRRVSAGTTAPYRINLTLNRIKQTGVTVLPDGSSYQGLHPLLIRDDVLAVDLESALKIKLTPATINYKDGIIELPATVDLLDSTGATVATLPPSGRNIRFFYKAEGDWSVQFQKAYAQYDRDYSGGALDYRGYAITGAPPHRLWFAACNANNTMSVDYEYQDSDGHVRKIVGESHRASDALDAYGGVPSTYLDLKETPVRIFSVIGISARARVIWRDSERWRHVDLDTTLVRKPAE